jgi:hypothetical protein
VPALTQWKEIEARLDPDWDAVHLSFVPEDLNQAAAVLAPLGPGRSGRELRFQVLRGGAGVDRLENILGRLDRKRVWGELALVDAHVTPPAAAPAPVRRPPLTEQWDRELVKLPPGWRDLTAELELESTDFLAQAALAGAPLNPSRIPGEIALRFRVTERGGGGYGTSPEMTRRCLQRMDEIGVTGRLRELTALSDVDYVATQGPILGRY